MKLLRLLPILLLLITLTPELLEGTALIPHPWDSGIAIRLVNPDCQPVPFRLRSEDGQLFRSAADFAVHLDATALASFAGQSLQLEFRNPLDELSYFLTLYTTCSFDGGSYPEGLLPHEGLSGGGKALFFLKEIDTGWEGDVKTACKCMEEGK